MLATHLERFKRYPPEAPARGQQGIAMVAFTIDHEGCLVASRIVQSSGSATLDQETLAMLARAQPMPRPPDNILESELSFVVRVRFKNRTSHFWLLLSKLLLMAAAVEAPYGACPEP